jgi:hypothetical protein
VHDVAATCSILGAGILAVLHLIPPFVAGVFLGAFVVYLLFHRQLRLRQSIIGYGNVQKACHNALLHMKHGVWIFAGDLSWIPRDQDLLLELRKRIPVFIIASAPTSELDQLNATTARSVVTELRFYPVGATSLRVLIFEPNESNPGIIAIEKQIRPSAQNLVGSAAAHPDALAIYKATITTATRDALLVNALKALFLSYWGDDDRLKN